MHRRNRRAPIISYQPESSLAGLHSSNHRRGNPAVVHSLQARRRAAQVGKHGPKGRKGRVRRPQRRDPAVERDTAHARPVVSKVRILLLTEDTGSGAYETVTRIAKK